MLEPSLEILRFLPPARSPLLAQSIHELVLQFVSQNLDVPLDSTLVQDVLSAPLSKGGLNVVHQVTESALILIQNSPPVADVVKSMSNP